MGLLVDGVWRDEWYDTEKTGGRFVRTQAQFRNWITRNGNDFPAESGRYHLYVSPSCPWAHRTLIIRSLKGLQSHISVSYVYWFEEGKGWSFDRSRPAGLAEDADLKYLYEIYLRQNPAYSGRVSVPVLWDKKTRSIVNNESSEIIRMLGSAFDGIGALHGDYYPASLRDEIDELNARIYEKVNNGVYRSGFATSQTAYEEAVTPLFDTLDYLDTLLKRNEWLVGNMLTEADIRLFPTLLRFDPVYYSHFKCNLRQIRSYPNLWQFTRRFYALPGVAETVDIHQIKRHYYFSNRTINPTGIVPIGPEISFE